MAVSSVAAQLAIERVCGISAHVHDGLALETTYKQRWSDFIVHEVSRSGDVMQLSSFALPAPEAAAEASEAEKAVASDRTKSIVGPDVWEALRKLFADASAPSVELPAPEVKEVRKELHGLLRTLCGTVDSDTRDGPAATRLMTVWRTDRPGNSAAGGRPGQKRSRPTDGGGGGGSYQGWPSTRPPYMSFTLHKQNADTVSAIELIARLARVNGKSLGTAGSKDKRAYTSQEVRCYHLDAERFHAALQRGSQGGKLMRGVYTGNYKYVAEPLSLGSAGGNKFDLILRDLQLVGSGEEASARPVTTVAQLAAALATRTMNARQTGTFTFLNYFGLQRFGSEAAGASATHRVGTAVVSRDWLAVCKALLAPSSTAPHQQERSSAQAGAEDSARQYFASTGDAQGALARWPVSHGGQGDRDRGGVTYQSTEEKLLRALADAQKRNESHTLSQHTKPGEQEAATVSTTWTAPARTSAAASTPSSSSFASLTQAQAQHAFTTTVSPKLRPLYVHALQAVVWNRLATARLSVSKTSAVAGDLVVVRASSATGAGAGMGGSNGFMVGVAEDEDGDGDALLEDEAEGSAADMSASERRQLDALPSVHVVSEGEAQSGLFSIQDVVLPQPGFGVQYPTVQGCDALTVLQLLVAEGVGLPSSATPATTAAQAEEVMRAIFKPSDVRYRFVGGYRRLLCTATHFGYRFVRQRAPAAAAPAVPVMPAAVPGSSTSIANGTGGSEALPSSSSSSLGRLPNVDLQASDVEAMRGYVAKEPAPAPGHQVFAPLLPAVVVVDPCGPAGEDEQVGREASETVALQLTFRLPPGSYATMLLRELTGGGAHV